jgi:signal transduction histidine kinase
VKKNIKILIVDDNENNLLSIEIVLEKEGYAFSRALSGREALRILLQDQDFSLILLDVKMPTMDGYETAELIYQRDSLKDIPIIFITAHDYEEAALFKGYKAGAVDFIRKPFNPEMLRTKVAVFAEIFKKNQLLKQQEEKLKAINEDLLRLNQELENRVAERTAELEGLNTELKALNLSKDRFFSVISHDLRNPLTSIMVSSEYINRNSEEISPSKVKVLSGIIHKTSKGMLQQLNELVEWAIQQREKSKFDPCRLELKEEVEKSINLLASFAAQKDIQLQSDIPEDICINGDEHMLRSIIQNLITNAIKYTPVGGRPVVITAVARKEVAEIWVEDHGVGMSEGTRKALLDDFRSVSNAGTNQEKGSGLGLLLVREFVAQHGGTLSIDSELNVGTRFGFTIPLSLEPTSI